jgi:NADH-quinone oxidoreductase subunit C
MFGIYFFNNKDLRRLLTDYSFIGYPLRKDYPLSGYIDVRYDDSINTIVYESVILNQAFRAFNFQNP